jgi:hypothetical protein
MQISNRKYQYFEIDDEDFDMISKYMWGINSSGYMYTYTKGKQTLLHRTLLGLNIRDGKIVDHKDGDRCNNRRENLRLCTNSENCRNSRKQSNNTSGFKGVIKSGKKWQAQIRSEDKRFGLGTYDSKIEAAKAYDKASYELHKGFAKLNFDKNSESHFSKDTTSSFNFYKPSRSSTFYGVYYDSITCRWGLVVKSKCISGQFTDEEIAAKAYNQIVKKFGYNCKLNNIEMDESIDYMSMKYKPVTSSRYYGVTLLKRDNIWLAIILHKYIGRFKTEKEAAIAVDNHIIKNNLDKSKLNFLEVIGENT